MGTVTKRHGNTVGTVTVSAKVERFARNAKVTPVQAAQNSVAAENLSRSGESAALLDFRGFILAVMALSGSIAQNLKLVGSVYAAQFKDNGMSDQQFASRQTRYRLAAALAIGTGELPGESARHDLAYTGIIGGAGSAKLVEVAVANLNAGLAHDAPLPGKTALEAGEGTDGGEGQDESETPAGGDSDALVPGLVATLALVAKNVRSGYVPNADEYAALVEAMNTLTDALESVEA